MKNTFYHIKYTKGLAVLMAALMLLVGLSAVLRGSSAQSAVRNTAFAEDDAGTGGDEDESILGYGSTPGDPSELFGVATKGGASRDKYHMNNDINMDFSVIRVLITLARPGVVYELSLDLLGEYYFESEMKTLGNTEGEPVHITVTAANRTVTATDEEGNVLASGESICLDRVYLTHTAGYAVLHTGATGGGDGNKYLGNFVFDTDTDGSLRMINHVPMAHYMYGVVEHEMSHTCKPDALKAQAIAAKCYGMCFMSETGDYDVMDGYDMGTYQLYRGYSTDPGKLTVLPLCLEVMGEALCFGSKIIPTFYGASDGGETTLPSIAFIMYGGDPRYNPAYDVYIDNVDFAYSPRCKVISVTYGEQKGNDGKNYVSRFRDFVLYKARAELGVEYVRVASFTNMYAYMPVEYTQRDMRMVYVSAVLEDAEGNTLDYELNFEAKELKELAITDMDGSGDVYSSSDPYVFTTVYKIFWGEETASGYNLYVSRHGNGLGLSQHGAAAMALPEYGAKSYLEILSFYYPHFEYIHVKEADPEAPLACTLDISAYASCAGEAVILHSSPDTGLDSAICTLHKDDHIDVISVTDDGYWYLVLANGHLGYVYYTAVAIELFPAPAEAVFTLYSCACGEHTSLRTAPTVFANTYADVSGLEVTVWASIGNWYYVVTDKGAAGYLPKSAVEVLEEYEYDGSEPIPNASPEPFYITVLGREEMKPGNWGRV